MEDESKNKSVSKYARRMAFSKFVASKKARTKEECHWKCCDKSFKELREIHRHIALSHGSELEVLSANLLDKGDKDARWSILRKPPKDDKLTDDDKIRTDSFPTAFNNDDVYSWLPGKISSGASNDEDLPGRILLFYKYRKIENTEHVKSWQQELCRRLGLTGKIRIGQEGLNATVGGLYTNTGLYIKSVMAHPLFSDMTYEDFKESEGGAEVFSNGLQVGVYEEIVPMGVDPSQISHEGAGKHLNPTEFHNAVQEHLETNGSNSIFIDCRNFYESKIGKFSGSVTPNIRKFSYWPEYVEKNKEMFQNKKVYMYCTGGIRCERGSAYLIKKNISQDVYQLKGGIHKYIEKYPDGYFRGKLFVFDDRYAIKANDDIVSNCVYCGEKWDKYSPCSSTNCYQLVLSCTSCRQNGLTACCPTCKKHMEGADTQKEQCECTQKRNRIPTEITESTKVPKQ